MPKIKSENEGHNGYYGICLKSLHDKIPNSHLLLLQITKEKRELGRGGPIGVEKRNGGSRERRSSFSLEIRAIGP